MKIQNIAVQLQLGESLIQFYTEHSLERQYFEGRYMLIYLGSLSTCTWQFFNIFWTFSLKILCKKLFPTVHTVYKL